MSLSVATIRGICAVLCLVGWSLVAPHGWGQDDRPSELLLPAGTKAWVSIPDAEVLKAALESTQFGKMMQDETVKPFADDLTNQFRTWLNEKNIKFGMKVADIEQVKSGEIAVAGVLSSPPAGAAGAKPANAPLQHAIVLLVDVRDSKQQAEELLKKVAKELESRNATSEVIEVGGVKATKWSFEKPRGLREKQYAYHGIVGNWLLACGNETVFRQMAFRITNPQAEGGAAVLANNPAFIKIKEQCGFPGKNYETHIRWFVEPFGYVQLAQAIADAENGRSVRDDYVGKFQEQGFSAIKGLGGIISLATGEHELVHRTFIHAPADGPGPDKYQRAAAMLEFDNPTKSNLGPPPWVPKNATSYVSFTWNLRKALEKAGHLIDAIGGTEGSWERTLDGLRDDLSGPRVDVRALAEILENRITIATATELPITESSERVLIGVKIRENEELVADSVHRMVQSEAQVIQHGETEILVVDTTKPGSDEIPEEFELDFGGAIDEGDHAEADEDEIEEPKPLFEKRVFAVKDSYLLVGNDVEYVKHVLDTMKDDPGKELMEAADYVRIDKSLRHLVTSDAPNLRHFGRIDKSIQGNYEMMRQGKMPQSKTILAQMLNRAFTAADAPEDFVRQQKIDGSKMPADFEGQVAKYFGPAGTWVQSLEEGWLITGCILKKDDVPEVAIRTGAQGANGKKEHPKEQVAKNPPSGKKKDDKE